MDRTRWFLSLAALALATGCGGATPDPERGGAGGAAGGAGAGEPTRVAGGSSGDRDGDGVPDGADQCPEQPEIMNGFEDEDGCPEFDQDRDGIFGSADLCPTDPEDLDGDQDEDGCPDVDSDGDGVADSIDRCPGEMETLNAYEDSDGCADEVPDKVKKFSGTIDGIAFGASSANIDKRSYRVLDEAAEVLREYPTVRVEIQGHTDDSGPRERNLILSQQRADAVRAYLIEKGIDPNRLVAKGYGPDEPRASNKTRRGQAKNRRVEFELLGDSKKK